MNTCAGFRTRLKACNTTSPSPLPLLRLATTITGFHPVISGLTIYIARKKVTCAFSCSNNVCTHFINDQTEPIFPSFRCQLDTIRRYNHSFELTQHKNNLYSLLACIKEMNLLFLCRKEMYNLECTFRGNISDTNNTLHHLNLDQDRNLLRKQRNYSLWEDYRAPNACNFMKFQFFIVL